MERIWTADVPSYAGQEVRLAGWLHRSRQLSTVTFLILRDGSGLAQVVLSDAAAAAEWGGTPEETVLEVTGRVAENPKAPNGVEIVEPSIRLLSDPAETLPFDLFRPKLTAGLPAQLDEAAVSLRHPLRRRTFELAAASLAGFRATLDARRFVEVTSPKIVASATESGANVFGIDYFGQRAFLAQSPQFYKQTLVGVFERVYEVGPVFRAEPHDTTRHLASYTSLDAELGFVTDHTTVMAVLRDVIAGMLDSVRSRLGEASDVVSGGLPVVDGEIPTVHFAEAQELISAATGESVVGEPDLAPAHERWLGNWAKEKFGSDFLYVTGYPMVKRPFYTHPDPSRPAYSNSFDLLFRGMELVTGGQRLHNYADYLAALESRGESPEPYRWYLKAFRHGMPPHGGFAIGLERWTARLTGAANVRETTLFPRDLHRLTP